MNAPLPLPPTPGFGHAEAAVAAEYLAKLEANLTQREEQRKENQKLTTELLKAISGNATVLVVGSINQNLPKMQDSLDKIVTAILKSNSAPMMGALLNNLSKMPKERIKPEDWLNSVGIGKDETLVTAPSLATIIFIKSDFLKEEINSGELRQTIFNNFALSKVNFALSQAGKESQLEEMIRALGEAHKERFCYSALAHASRNTGPINGDTIFSMHEQNFAFCLNNIDTKQAAELCDLLINHNTKLLRHGTVSSELANSRFRSVVEKITDQSQLKNLCTLAIKQATPEQVSAIRTKVFLEKKDVLDLLYAACKPANRSVSPIEYNKEIQNSLENLKNILLTPSLDSLNEKELGGAIFHCIHSRKPDHLVELVEYAKEKNIILSNHSTPNGHTLFIEALMLKDSSGKYDSADTFVVEKMGLKLLETGADIARTDRAGNNPLSILGQRGMKDGALYTAAQSTVSAQAQASVVMNAKLGLLQAALPLIREYIALGFSPQEAAAAAGLTLPPPTANPAKQTYLALPQGTAPAAAPPQPEQGQNPRE